MESKSRLKEGELLKLLADRSQLRKSEIAKELKIRATTLSKIFKSEKLSPKVKHEAARVFRVSVEYFSDAGMSDVVLPVLSEPPPPEYQTGSSWQDIARQESELKMEIERLKEQVRQAAARISEKEGTIQEQKDMIQRLLSVIEKK